MLNVKQSYGHFIYSMWDIVMVIGWEWSLTGSLEGV